MYTNICKIINTELHNLESTKYVISNFLITDHIVYCKNTEELLYMYIKSILSQEIKRLKNVLLRYKCCL